MAGFDVSGIGGNQPGPSGLLMGLDPAYQAKQADALAAQLALKRATAFQNGVPTNPDGSIDIDTIGRTQIQNGDAAGGLGLLMTGQKLALLRDPSTISNPTGQGGGAGAGGAGGSLLAGLNGAQPAAGGGGIAPSAGGDDYGRAPGGGYGGSGQVGAGGLGVSAPVPVGQRSASSAGGQSVPATGSLDPLDIYAHSIGSLESGNRYDALGQKQSSGAQAIGRYQVMSSNVPSWTKEVLGTAMSAEDFRNSPEAQDAVFRAKFGQAVDKYGNPFDAASVWFSGRPLARAGNASDSLGTTVPAYIQKFAAGLGPASQALRGGQAAAGGVQAPTGGQGQAAGGAAPQGGPAAPVSFNDPASSPPTTGGTAAQTGAYSDDAYQTAKRVVAHFENADPSTMSLNEQRAVTKATEIVGQREDPQSAPAGASAGTAAGAPTSSSPTPPSGQHPFAPGSNAVTGMRAPTPSTMSPGVVPTVSAGAQPGGGGFQPVSFAGGPGASGGAAPAPSQAPVLPGRQPPQAGGAAPLGAMPPEVAAALSRLQSKQGSPADGATWSAYMRSVGGVIGGGGTPAGVQGSPSAPPQGGQGLAAPMAPAPARPTGPDLPYLQGQYAAPGGGAQYVSDLLDKARRYGLAGEQQAAQTFETRAKQVQDDLAAINKSRLDLQTHNAELTPEQKAYRDAQAQGFQGTPLDYLNTVAGGKANANAAGRNATLTPGEKEFQQAVAGGFQGTQADYQASVAAQKAEAEGQGKFYGELPAKYAQAADAGRAANDNVDQMLTAAQGFRMGAGAGLQQDARKALQGVMGFFGVSDPKLNDPTASYEDFGKMAGAHLRNVVSAISGPKGIQEMQLVGSSLPSAEQSYDGFRAVSASLKGSNDFAIAKQQASQDWLSDPSHRGSLSGFEASFNRNASPSTFWLNRLRVDQPDLFTQAVTNLGKTDQGRVLLIKAKTGMAWANKNGLFD